jgi:hypothetical protein
MYSRSRCPRGLSCGFVVARLLGLQVRTQQEAWMFSVVSVVCCQVEVSASGWSLIRKTLTECVASECDLKTSKMKRFRLTRAVEPKKLIVIFSNCLNMLHDNKENWRVALFLHQDQDYIAMRYQDVNFFSLRYSFMTLHRKLKVSALLWFPKAGDYSTTIKERNT